MPSSITHSYFALDLYNALPHSLKRRINHQEEYLKLFSQGSDPFMFYMFFTTKKGQNIQYKMHTKDTQKFFLNTVEYIHKNRLSHDKYSLCYLYGFIAHYCLDLNAHPFIYYKSGVFKRHDKSTYMYNSLHQKIEYSIDNYFIETREVVNPKNFRIDKFIFNNCKINDTLSNLIDYSIGNTYNIKSASSLYKKSIKNMKTFFYLFNYDPFGIKLKFYQTLDFILPQSITKLEELSYYQKYDKRLDYLNDNKKTWNLPWDKSVKFNTSFMDLYNRSLNDAVNMISKVTILLDKEILDINRVKILFNNLSFTTGLDCNKEVLMKYFEKEVEL